MSLSQVSCRDCHETPYIHVKGAQNSTSQSVALKCFPFGRWVLPHEEEFEQRARSDTKDMIYPRLVSLFFAYLTT